MSQIRICFSGVSSANQILRRSIREISKLEQEFALLQKAVDPDIQSRYRIAEKLSALHYSAEVTEKKARGILAVTSEGLQRYQETEARLCRSAPDYEEQDAR